MDRQPQERSLFWPIVLIGAGTIWLLSNFNVIQELSWVSLVRLWPLALIAAGLDMLFGRSHSLVSGLIGLLTVGAAVALLVAGPRLGLAPSAPELKTERFSEPLDGANSAEVTLDLAEFPTTVSALEGSDELIDAELTHTGQVRFDVNGTARRAVRLDYSSGIDFFFMGFGAQGGEWNIGLSPSLPLRLVVDAGSGTSALNLGGLQLEGLSIDGGSGAITLDLPAAEEAYDVELDGGSGAQTVLVPVDAAGTLSYDGGSGSLRVEVADTAAVRVEVRDSGSGGVRVPSGWDEVESGDDDEGVWQSATYEDSEGRAMLIVIEEVGSGQIEVGER